MRYLFRPDRHDQDSLVEIPFYKNRPLLYCPVFYKNCPLLRSEFVVCAEHYAQYAWAGLQEKFLAPRKHGRPPQSHKPTAWLRQSDLEGLGLSPAEAWNCEKALWQLRFSETKLKRSQAIKRINPLVTRGLNPVRRAIAKERDSILILPARRKLSGRDIVNLVYYRAQRQFLWAFLRHESERERRLLKKITKSDRAVQALSQAYAYLTELDDFKELIPPRKAKTTVLGPGTLDEAITDGLKNPHQADADAALKFGLKVSSVRPLLHKYLRR
jgi:hypothetical protein